MNAITKQAPANIVPTKERSAPRRVTGRLKVALDDMVWTGVHYSDAAKAAGLTTRAMRVALTKPHVLAYLRAERQSLRASEGPRTLHRLVALRDQDANRAAAVQAARAIEGLPNENHPSNRAAQYAPGLVIVIKGNGRLPDRTIGPPMIDVTPTAPAEDGEPEE
jgi:hypothetical protein